MPNPYGKYPTSSAIKRFLEATDQYYAKSTQAERKRKMYLMGRTMKELGAPPTPHKWKEKDIQALVKRLKEKGLENSTQQKYLMYLKDFLGYCGNTVMIEMLSRKEFRMPKRIPKDTRSLPQDTLQHIHDSTITMEGWRGSVARLITMLYPYTGLRPSELRTLKYSDIDTSNWHITVSHPKGEDLYGKKRLVPILPQIRPILSDYLEERRLCLEAHEKDSEIDIFLPYITKQGKVRVWSDAELRKLKARIQRECGVSFKLKDYRASFCQIAIDLGAELQAVSKIMGHSTTKTTEQYYGRIRDTSALTEIERAFSEPHARRLKSAELTLSQI